MIKKNRLLPLEELPEWAKSLPLAEREMYVSSPQCRVCNAVDRGGKSLRGKLEAMVLEGKGLVYVCNAARDLYGVTILPDSLNRHMERHTPSYMEIIGKMMQASRDEVISGAYGSKVDQFRVAKMIMEKGFWEVLADEEKITPAILIKVAEAYDKMVRDIQVPHEGLMSQEDVTILLDIIHTVMTLEQREEVKRRWSIYVSEEEAAITEGEVVVEADGPTTIEVDGEIIDVGDIPTLPPEE